MPGVGHDMDGMEDCNPVSHQNQCLNYIAFHVVYQSSPFNFNKIYCQGGDLVACSIFE
jgi:hypothetical protein